MILTHVERVLRKYCEPGGHRYGEDAVDSDFEQCRTCGRRQRTDGSTCLLCDGDGAAHYELQRESPGMSVAGQLCHECSGELTFRGPVRGWAIRRARAA